MSTETQTQEGGVISSIFGFMGRVVGETVHQCDKLYEGSKDVAGSIVDDVCNIPDAISKGYDEELFAAPEGGKPEEVSEIKTTEQTDVVATVQANEPEQPTASSTFPPKPEDADKAAGNS